MSLVLAAPAIAAATDPWPMFHGGMQRTGRSAFSGPASGTIRWRFPLEDTASSPAIGADGTIYIGSKGGLRAVRPNGSQKWRVTYNDDGASSPAIGADGTIYIGVGTGLYAVRSDGAPKWWFGATDVSPMYWSSPAIDSSGTIYIASERRLYAINANKTKKWDFPLTQSSTTIRSSPAIGPDGTIYIGRSVGPTNRPALCAVNPDGSEKWTREGVGGWSCYPAVDDDGTVYVGSAEGVAAVSSTGTLMWTYTTGDYAQWSGPAIGSTGTVHVAADGLYSFSRDGQLEWKFTGDTPGSIGQGMPSSPAVGADGTVYVGCNDGKLYAVNRDGTKKWTMLTSAYVESSPAIDGSGTVYVGSRDGGLYAVGEPWNLETSITIKTNATTTYVGKTPILSGAVGPTQMIGVNIVVYVMKPGKTYWSYSSNRTVYEAGGKPAWQYKYYFKPGMAKGYYRFKAVAPAPGFPSSSGFRTSTSPSIVTIRLR